MNCLEFRAVIGRIEEIAPRGKDFLQLQLHVNGETVCVVCRQFALASLYRLKEEVGEECPAVERLNLIIYYPPTLIDQSIEQQRAFVADKLCELTPEQRRIVYNEILKEDFRDGDEHLPWHDIVKRFVAKHT